MDKDQTLEVFCTKVLDWRHRTIPRVELERVATYLRDVVAPALGELEQLRAAKARR
jgi:hypothetical protein